MAKMFYTLEETAQALGVSEDDVKQMVEDGKLQQFRDRDQVMFKRDQVDQLAGGGGQPADPAGADADDEDDDSDITLMPDEEETQASKTDAIDLSGDTGEHEAQGAEAAAESDGGGGEAAAEAGLSVESEEQEQQASGEAGGGEQEESDSGVSVFGAEDEVETADAMEETQLGADTFGDDEINFDGGGGSGSGLLDLTRESDDTSLGAVELLDDEEGGEAEGGEEATEDNTATISSSSGVFEGELGAAEDAEGPAAPVGGGGGGGAAAAAYAIDESDPPGDGFGGGMLLGVFVTLTVALLIVTTGMQGMIIELTGVLSQNARSPWMYGGLGLAGLCIVLSLIGWMIGRSRA